MLAVFNQKRLSEQLIGGKIIKGNFRKAAFDIIRSTDGGEGKNEGSGKILTLRDKKTNIDQATTGKEIGLVVNSSLLIKAGDKLIIRK